MDRIQNFCLKKKILNRDVNSFSKEKLPINSRDEFHDRTVRPTITTKDIKASQVESR